MTEPVNNLTLKLASLTTTLGGKLDTIAADIAALRLDMAALRGDAPSNTLQSINQSLWNIAGTAPGTTLTDLLAAISANAGGDSSTALATIIGILGDMTTAPAGHLYTVRYLLAALNDSLVLKTGDLGYLDLKPSIPPAGLACGGPWTRGTSVTHVGIATDHDGVNYDAWTIGFPDFMLVPVTDNVEYRINHALSIEGRRFQRAYTTNSGREGAVICFSWNLTSRPLNGRPTKIAIGPCTLFGDVTYWFPPITGYGANASIFDATVFPQEGPLPLVYGDSVPVNVFDPDTGYWNIGDTVCEMLLLMEAGCQPDYTDYFISAKGAL